MYESPRDMHSRVSHAWSTEHRLELLVLGPYSKPEVSPGAQEAGVLL